MRLVRSTVPVRWAAYFFFLRRAVLFVLLIHRTALAGNFYAGTSPGNVPWPGGVVPYEFTNTLTTAMKQTYLDGLREWELAANVKFVPHTNQTRWILFTYNTNFQNTFYGNYSPQVVDISSLSRAQVGHEMGHSFGFNHENIRPDQTNYLIVLSNNVALGNLSFLLADPTTVTNGNYDFESVMHLGWDFGSTQQGVLATQQPKPPFSPRYQFRMGNLCLSPGDRAALKFLYGPPAVPLTNIVTTTADAGPGSLRAAMYYATDHPGSMVKFNIATNDAGYSNGVFYIHLTGHLPPLATDGLVIDGSTQPGFTSKPLIAVDGSRIIRETFTSNSGLLIFSANNQVKNISFSGFNWNGLLLEYADATNNTIAGCWLGLDATGSNAVPNAYQGIYLMQGASRNFIGGTNALARNVISGNAQYGVYISDSNTVGNVVLGNYISTDASGSNAVPNGKSGVFLGGGTSGNLIGSTNAAGRNILSGNPEYGVYLSNTSSNVILGNYIGMNAGGAASLGNTLGGIDLFSGAQNNLIGGTGKGARNIISGNAQYGLLLIGANSNAIQGNYIGPDASGKTAPANDNSYGGIGMWGGSANNLIGGTIPGAGNLISGNSSYGLFLQDPSTSGNLIQGNFIGADLTGTNALGNSYAGVALWGGATNNSIGGNTVGAGNTIAFNGYAGVNIYDAPTTNNSIRGNSIFSNSGLGIDLVGASDVYPYVTLNDIGDGDIGPNNGQNYPVITNAFGSGTSTVILGKLNSATNRNYFIDVYRNLAPDFTGYGEGQYFLGTVSVTTDGSGNAAFAFTNSSANYAGQYISTTATDTSSNTSEFSADVLATNLPTPFAQFASPLIWQANGFIFNLTFATNVSYHIQATTNLGTNPIPWVNLTNFTATVSSLTFADRTATNFRTRFYRVTSP